MGWDEESNAKRAPREGTAGSALQSSCSKLLLSPPPPSPFQIIPCCKSFRQADILWKVRIDSDNISCGKSPLEKGKKKQQTNCFWKVLEKKILF